MALLKSGTRIYGTATIDTQLFITGSGSSTSTNTGALQIVGGAGIGGNLHVGGEIVANKLTIQLTTVTTTLIETDDIIKTTNATQATATATGALQIAGGASVGGNLWVGGNIIGNVVAYYSDERLKTRLGKIDNAVDIIKSLTGFRYVNNDVAKAHGYDTDKVQLGVSAQEVEAVLPEIVDLAAFDIDVNSPDKKSKTGENYKTVQYDRLVPVLIEAVKEQQEIIDEQNAKINMLEEKLNSIISLLGEK